MSTTISLKNFTNGSIFYQIGDNEMQKIGADKSVTLKFPKNSQLKVGWMNGYGDINWMIKNQQCLSGEFLVLYQFGMPKIEFKETKINKEMYNEMQLIYVGEELQKANLKSRCKIDPKHPQICENLIKTGVLSENQLDQIIKDMFD